MQTINTCNFNTVKEAYLHVISCILVTLIMSLQYTAYGSSGQQTSFSLFHSRPAEKKKTYFLTESLRTVTSTLLCSRCAKAKPRAKKLRMTPELRPGAPSTAPNLT